MRNQANILVDTAMQGLAEAIRQAHATAQAASIAAGPELAADDFQGTYGEVWRQLWHAARAFSIEHAYPGEPYPVATIDARCVLCQQLLGAQARDRYARFQRFVADATRRQADAASLRLAELRKVVESCQPLGPGAAAIRADLDREAPGLFESVERFVESLDARHSHVVTCLERELWAETPPLVSWPGKELSGLIDKLQERAKEELLADDPEHRRTLNAERAELADQKWLAANKEAVKSRISRFAHVGKLKDCQRDCLTNAITLISSELHATHVTSAFCEAFQKELKELRLATLPVKLQATKGTKGEHRFAVKLDGAPTAKAVEVASEGEHRCIALAAFLAELSLASHQSALVFDDPVSSVDHLRRDAIAVRLVKEAAVRQVIVFTHDLAFMCDLKSAADASHVSIHYQQIERMAGKPGRVVGEVMWDGKSTKSP